MLPMSSASAHELWLETESWQSEVGEEIFFHIVNGEDFSGVNLAYFPNRVLRFDLVEADALRAVDSRAGDVPAATVAASDQGLMIALYETEPSKISYKSWEKFQNFVDHKDFGADVRARHEAAGHPTEGFSELYTRHAKALVGIGSGEGRDKAFGLETEIVALTNPYAADFDGQMQMRVLYQGAPRQDVQVEVFDKTPDGSVVVDRSPRTNSDGIVTVAVRAGHTYLIDAVVLRPAEAETGSAWETLWAALTFQVPSE